MLKDFQFCVEKELPKGNALLKLRIVARIHTTEYEMTV